MKKMTYLRIAAGSTVLFVALIAFHVDKAWGTLCALCPVGFAGVAVASRSIPWELVPGVVLVLVVIFLVGKAFCSWLCPSSFLKTMFGGRTPRGLKGISGKKPRLGGCKTQSCQSCSSASENMVVPGIVLAALLVVSFVVRFPVFCLFCPIGLVFGTLWAVNRMFVLLQPGWELLIFPLILFLELFLFKRWCSSICPIGFMFALITKLRNRMRLGISPQVNTTTCLKDQGCEECLSICPEDIDVPLDRASIRANCTSCLECVEACPSKSIRMGNKGL